MTPAVKEVLLAVGGGWEDDVGGNVNSDVVTGPSLAIGGPCITVLEMQRTCW